MKSYNNFRELRISMEKHDGEGPDCDNSTREEYKKVIEIKARNKGYIATKTGDRELDIFGEEIARFMGMWDGVNPYSKDPLKPIYNRAMRFLQRHSKISYSDLVKGVNYDGLEEGDFALLQKRGLRKRLFDYRAVLYLAALDSCEERGLNPEEVMKQVQDAQIRPIKKQQHEPTFDYLRDKLLNKTK